MKKKIATVVFVGVIALISMGFKTVSSGNDFPDGSKISIIKGSVYNSDRDRDWEMVTFGLSGLNCDEYVAFVNIFDKGGDLICTIDDLDESWDTEDNHSQVSWYAVNLNKYRIRRDFILEVHVKGEGSATSVRNMLSNTINADGPPIDPEETILIVKYP